VNRCLRVAAVFLSLLITPSALAQRIHTLIISDTSPSAQWGKYEPHVTMDATMVFSAFANNVPEQQWDFQSLPIGSDDQSDPRIVLQALDEIEVAANDTLVVYYTGHGASDDAGHYLQLAAGKLYRRDLRRAMEAKGARLNVLLTDCCNNRSDGREMFAAAPMAEPPPRTSPAFESLFVEPQGWVDVSASAPGESAFFNANFEKGEDFPGSLFTTELTRFLDEFKSRRVSWEQLVRQVSLGVHVAFKQQYPRGAQAAKGLPVQSIQNVFAVDYPGMPGDEGPRSGLTIRDFDGRGAMITQVRTGFPASEAYDVSQRRYASLLPRQVIVAVNGQSIRSASDFVEATSRSPQIMNLRVLDGEGTREFLLRLRY
jgi:hypothetical protein